MNVTNFSAHENSETVLSRLTQNYFVWILRGGIGLGVILGFVYLLLLNSLSIQGFALEEIKAERLEIQKITEATDIELAIPTSLYALQSSEQVQEMDLAEQKVFLKTTSEELAFYRP
jgi:hypothetical protein